MNEIKSELNKPLIIFTFIIVMIGGTFNELIEPVYYSNKRAFITGIVMLIISPNICFIDKSIMEQHHSKNN